MSTNPPDHSAIIAAVASLGAKFDGFKEESNRRLDKQDRDLEVLMAAHNVAVGKGIISKLLFATIPGGLGAAIVKLVDWAQNGPPPMPGSH